MATTKSTKKEEKTSDEAKEPKTTKTAKRSAVDVFDASGAYIRTYSKERHGDDFEKLAKEFVGKKSNKAASIVDSDEANWPDGVQK